MNIIKLTPDIFQMVVPFPQGTADVNSYLVRGKRGFTIIDTGIPSDAAKQVWNELLDNREIRVEQIVITHIHPDHVGLARWLREKVQAPIVMSNITQNIFRRIFDTTVSKAPNPFFLAHGGPEVPGDLIINSLKNTFVEADEHFEHGQEIPIGDGAYQCLYTPGHSPDHFCFYSDVAEVLFLGDLVLNEISPIIPMWDESDGNLLAEYFQSLEAIAPRTPTYALAGHNGPIENLQVRIEEIQNAHAYRLKQILEYLDTTRTTAAEITRAVYPKTSDSEQFLMSFQSTLARLTYLRERGEIESNTQDGKIVFYRQ